MSDGWLEEFLNALLKYVQEHGHPAATKVTGWDDSAEEWGGCETCYNGLTYEVEITFEEPGYNYGRIYTYNGKFTDLLYELTR